MEKERVSRTADQAKERSKALKQEYDGNPALRARYTRLFEIVQRRRQQSQAQPRQTKTIEVDPLWPATFQHAQHFTDVPIDSGLLCAYYNQQGTTLRGSVAEAEKRLSERFIVTAAAGLEPCPVPPTSEWGTVQGCAGSLHNVCPLCVSSRRRVPTTLCMRRISMPPA